MSTTTKNTHINSQFCDVLKDLGHKRLLPELDAAIRDVTKAVNDTGGAGEITLKIKIKRSNRSESGSVEMAVEGNLATKIPKAKHPASLFFLNEDTESLTRDDPQQDNLPGVMVVEKFADA